MVVVTRTTEEEPQCLSLKQKIIIFDGTSVNAETLGKMDDSQIDFNFMRAHGVKAVCLSAAGVTPKILKSRGTTSASDLKSIGFEAIDLVKDSSFCSYCIAAFGADDIVQTFLVTPSDSVMIANSPAMHQLGITSTKLLSICAGSANEAFWTLKQLPIGTGLTGVPVSVVLDTGLRGQGMRNLGYQPDLFKRCTGCNQHDLNRMDF